jgi:hypothetical protein
MAAAEAKKEEASQTSEVVDAEIECAACDK